MTNYNFNRQLIGPLFLILTIEYFLAQFIAQLGWPGYSIRDLDVSALGITTCGPFMDPTTKVTFQVCSPLHLVMNAGFILLGILTIVGMFLSRGAFPKRKLTSTGILFITLGGLGEILAGLFPGNVNLALHAIGALLHWVIGGTGVLLIGFGILRTNRAVAIFSLICAAIVIIGFFLYGNHVYLGLGRGGMERVTAYPQTIWLIVIGLILYKRSKSGSPAI